MIIIWDNGGVHSDHAVDFVDCGDYRVVDCVAVMKAQNPNSSGFLVAVAEKLDWRAAGSIDKIEDQVVGLSSDKWGVLRDTIAWDMFIALVIGEVARLKTIRATSTAQEQRIAAEIASLESLLRMDVR